MDDAQLHALTQAHEAATQEQFIAIIVGNIRSKALAEQPAVIQHFVGLSGALFQKGFPIVAQDVLAGILEHDALNTPALFMSAAVSLQSSDFASAREQLELIIGLEPNHHEAMSLLAKCCFNQKDWSSAQYYFAQLYAQKLLKGNVDEYGWTLIKCGSQQQGFEFLQSAYDTGSGTDKAALYLARYYKDQKDFVQAVRFYDAFLTPQSDHLYYKEAVSVALSAELHNEAETWSRYVLSHNPHDVTSLNNLVSAGLSTKDYDSLIGYANRACDLKPENPQYQTNRALLHLMHGHFRPGWVDFEARLQLDSFNKTQIDAPMWQGEDLTQGTLLIHQEQGFGDTIQFLRFMPQVLERVGHVELHLQAPLIPLYDGIWGDRVTIKTYGQNISQVDAYTPIMSLALIFSMDSEHQIPDPYPLLSIDAQHTSIYEQRETSKRVGLVWSGNPGHANDHNRSVSFALLKDAFSALTIDWVDLQYMPHDSDRLLGDDFFKFRPMEDVNNFADLAVALKGIDLLISVDSAPLHLAATLGIPTWGLIAYTPDWRWMLRRDDSPWYPSLSLYRQKVVGDWREPLSKIRAQLEHEFV